jgi:lipoyl(octanoyl) transferase
MQLLVRELGVSAYATALALQEDILARKIAGDTHDYLLLLEHEPVYTLGRGADGTDLLNADHRFGVPSFRVGRGGGATFHGPGQLVAYPLLTLGHGGRDVHRYVRALEEVLILACRDFGITAARRDGLTGVWVGGAKIASIGIGVRRWTTSHGIALNVSTDLSFFDRIVPCRMPDVHMTSMALELGGAPPMSQVSGAFVHEFRSVFGYAEPESVRECRA